MSIGKFVSSLLPSFERSRIEEDIRMLKDDFGNTIPPFEAAAEHFKREQFKSAEVKNFDKIFQRTVKVDRSVSGNFVNVIAKSIVRSQETVSILEEKVDKLFGRDVTATGITYARANILRYIEMVAFANKYARKLLVWVYDLEKRELKIKIGDPFTKAEMKWLVDNRLAFLKSIEIMSLEPRTVKVLIEKIPDMVVVPDEVDMVNETVGRTTIDPLSMGLIPLVIHPIYHIRMAFTEWQVARYQASLEEKRALEYRLLALKEAREGREDAKLEQQIEYNENRIKKLNYKLKQFEEG